MSVFAPSPMLLTATALALIASIFSAGPVRAETVVTVNVPLDLHEMSAQISAIRVRCGIELQDAVTGGWEEVVWHTVDVPLPANGELQTTVSVSFDRNAFYPLSEARLTGPMKAVCELGMRIGGKLYTVDRAFDAAPGPRAKKPGTILAADSSVIFP